MLKKAHRDLAAAQRQLWKLQKEVLRGVTVVIVFLLSLTLFRLSSIRGRVLSNTNHNGNANRQKVPIS